MKTIYILLIACMMCQFTFAQSNQLFVKQSPDGNELRWNPSDYQTWWAGLEMGYQIERSTDGQSFELIKRSIFPEVLTTQVANNEASELIQRILKATDNLQNTTIPEGEEEKVKGAYKYYRFLILESKAAMAGSGLYFIDKNVQSNTQYTYRVSLNNDDRFLATSDGYVPEVKLPDFVQKVEEHDLFINWTHQANPTWYNLYEVQKGGSPASLARPDNGLIIPPSSVDNASALETVWYDSLLSLNTPYYYQFSGIDPFADRIDGTLIEAIGKDLTAPSRPIILKVTEKDREVALSWQKPEKETDFVGFNIYRSTYSDTLFQQINKILLPINQTSFTEKVAGEYPWMNYYVTAVDQSGNESRTVAEHIVFVDKTPPAIPNGLSASIDDNGVVQLKWAANKEVDLKGYRVAAARYLDAPFMPISQEYVNELSHQDTLALNFKNKEFYYKISAMDVSYNASPYSTPIKVVLPDTIPPLPVQLEELARSATGVELRFVIEAEPDLAAVNVLRKAPNATSWDIIEAITDFKQTSYQDPIAVEANFEYTLQSIDQNENLSLRSAIRYARPFKATKKQEDFSLSYELTADQAVNLVWEQPLKTSYQVYRMTAEGKPKLLQTIQEGTYTDATVEVGKSYIYFVIAQNEQGVLASKSQAVEVKM